MKKGNGRTSLNGFQRLMLVLAFQGVIALLSTIFIPGDPKNSFFLSLSIYRWLIILGFLLVISFLVILIFKHKETVPYFNFWVTKISDAGLTRWFGFVFFVILWGTIWFPATRLPEFQEEIIRLKPFILFIELIFFESFIFYIWQAEREKVILILNKIADKKICRNILVAVVLIVGLFGGLRLIALNSSGGLGFNNPSASILPLQGFIALILFFSLFLLEFKNNKNNISKKKNHDILFFFLIWGCVFLLWVFTPFSCGQDRLGPFPPNYICYPQVNDSVYSIGSHYITLGRGIFNHWFTDKPFYMLFLAIGQWIFGQRIDQYLLFQSIVISMGPALLYLFIKKWISRPGAFFLTVLAAILGMNNILLYPKVGGVNINIENTELLTGFLLILLAISLIRFFELKGSKFYVFISGGILGIATLTRMNPIFIYPLVLCVLFFSDHFNFSKGIKNIIIFTLGFLIIFTPWLVIANDADGNNFYITKIEKILKYRYPIKDDLNLESNILPVALPEPVTVKQNRIVSINPSESIQPESSAIDRSNGNVLVYFLNNEFLSLAKLPMNLTLYSMPQVIQQPSWLNSGESPFWNSEFSVENLAALLLNLLIIISGIFFASNKFGISGIIPLLIQTGYLIGNGYALTSGDRYLQPVDWVTLLYFATGVYAFSRLLVSSEFSFSKNLFKDPVTVKSPKISSRLIKGTRIGNVLLFILVGLSLPLTNLVKDKITTKNTDELITLTSQIISESSDITREDINDLLLIPNSIVVEGIAYHARFYSSPIAFNKRQVFETTVLGNNKVYISNWIFSPSQKDIFDGSRVILVGCEIREKNFWGAETIIMKTLALIQLDGDKNILLVKRKLFICN